MNVSRSPIDSPQNARIFPVLVFNYHPQFLSLSVTIGYFWSSIHALPSVPSVCVISMNKSRHSFDDKIDVSELSLAVMS